MKKCKNILAILLFLIIFTNNYTYASMADFTDEDAEKQTQKMIQEHKENFDSTKSDNNFLKELTVNNGKISPNFDRQIIEYSVEVNNGINEIEIIANPEEVEAKVNGSGKVNIKDISEHKIEVIAPSGTTRTYFIKIIKENEEKAVNENEKKEDVNETVTEEENVIIPANTIKEENLVQESNDNNKNTKKYVIGGVILIILLICFIIIIKIKSKEAKH